VILPDVNVLVYALRSDLAQHRACRKWLEEAINAEAPYGMSPQVLASMIRVATHPRIFVRPSRLQEAAEFASVLLRQPHCQVVQPGPRHRGTSLISAGRHMRRATSCRTPGWPRWLSSRVANGSQRTAISPGLRASGGDPRFKRTFQPTRGTRPLVTGAIGRRGGGLSPRRAHGRNRSWRCSG
jgi:predicted nucleic acid-binding protein